MAFIFLLIFFEITRALFEFKVLLKKNFFILLKSRSINSKSNFNNSKNTTSRTRGGRKERGEKEGGRRREGEEKEKEGERGERREEMMVVGGGHRWCKFFLKNILKKL